MLFGGDTTVFNTVYCIVADSLLVIFSHDVLLFLTNISNMFVALAKSHAVQYVDLTHVCSCDYPVFTPVNQIKFSIFV